MKKYSVLLEYPWEFSGYHGDFPQAIREVKEK
jgi:hypothetical protein